MYYKKCLQFTNTNTYVISRSSASPGFLPNCKSALVSVWPDRRNSFKPASPRIDRSSSASTGSSKGINVISATFFALSTTKRSAETSHYDPLINCHLYMPIIVVKEGEVINCIWRSRPFETPWEDLSSKWLCKFYQHKLNNGKTGKWQRWNNWLKDREDNCLYF